MEYSCKIIKYNPGEGFKYNAVVIFDFDIEVNGLRRLVSDLLGSSFLLPIKTIEYIDNNLGKFSDSYNSEIFSRASVEFHHPNGITVSFKKGQIQGWVENDELIKWGVRSVSEFFDGDLLKNVLLTNYRFGWKDSELTESYYISIKS